MSEFLIKLDASFSLDYTKWLSSFDEEYFGFSQGGLVVDLKKIGQQLLARINNLPIQHQADQLEDRTIDFVRLSRWKRQYKTSCQLFSTRYSDCCQNIDHRKFDRLTQGQRDFIINLRQIAGVESVVIDGHSLTVAIEQTADWSADAINARVLATIKSYIGWSKKSVIYDIDQKCNHRQISP